MQMIFDFFFPEVGTLAFLGVTKTFFASPSSSSKAHCLKIATKSLFMRGVLDETFSDGFQTM